MTMEFDKKTVVLADKRWLLMRISPRLLAALFLGVPALLFACLAILLFPGATWGELLARLNHLLAHIDWTHIDWAKTLTNLAMLGVVIGQAIYLPWAAERERLTLSPDGLRYTSPLPGSLKRLRPDWFLSWGEIHKVELSAPQGPMRNANLVSMALCTSSGKRRICPAVWVDPATYSRPPTRFSFRLTPMTQPRDETIKEVLASEVMRYISVCVPHLSIDSGLGQIPTAASLERDPHGRVAIAIVLGLILYAFLDGMAGPESYIDAPSSLLHIYIPAGLVGAILAGAWLYRSSLPAAEKLGLAMLIGVLVGVAMVPGALRINALTDSGGPERYDFYVVTFGADEVVLRPLKDGLPDIDYFARHAYWDRYRNGALYPVQVHKGILGFYQFNSSIIIDDMHNH